VKYDIIFSPEAEEGIGQLRASDGRLKSWNRYRLRK